MPSANRNLILVGRGPMVISFRTAQDLEGARVRMRFDDGHEVVATLLNATIDRDGSQHLIYDAIEWANQAGTYGGGAGTCYYAEAGTLLSLEPAGDPLAGATRS